uniref:Uncharacterized protein n=1 Tax=Rhizophora mucronata TaxID=61149 RepID=A0A2P2QFK9_RHIMU
MGLTGVAFTNQGPYSLPVSLLVCLLVSLGNWI